VRRGPLPPGQVTALSIVVVGAGGFWAGALLYRPHSAHRLLWWGAAVVAVVVSMVAASGFFATRATSGGAYRRLELLYAFTREIEQARDRADVLATLLAQLRSLLNVDLAECTVVGPLGWRRTTLGADGVAIVRDVSKAASLVSLVERGPVNSSELSGDGRAALIVEGKTSAIMAPLRVDGELIGVITVANPKDHQFGPADLDLVETLANHAAASLEHTRLLDQVRFDARHDPLTGLPNRYRFNELIAEVAGPCAVLLLDLDRFKEINNALGHHHGDLLLQSVGARMSAELGHKGTVARLGGDEFGVLLPNTAGGDAAQAAVSLLAALEQPFAVGELQLELTASVGVAANPTAGTDTTKLLQQADVAMYVAKRSLSGWELYSPERDHYSPRRLALAGELRKAIDNGELEVHYQPKAELKTGRILGIEALVRWQHPYFGLLGPDTFVPLAEHVGLIRPLTLKVLDSAIAEQHRLQARGFAVGVSVNLSVRSVLDVGLPNQVAELLASHDMAAGGLTLEITESSVMADPGRTIGILGRLDALGVSISLDDFGTGYSSLSYLKRLPVKEVKIDRTFVAGLLENESDAAIVRSTVDLARNLGLRVVAEGVEDRSTWVSLATLGCHEAQGYFVSAPLAADSLGDWIERTGLVIDPSR